MSEAAQNKTAETIYFMAVTNALVDAHNRIVVPAEHIKQGVKGDCHLVKCSTKSGYHYLAIYTIEKFKVEADKRLIRGDEDEDTYLGRKRLFFSGVKRQELNENKPRITLDDDMREHLNLVKPGTSLCLVGAGSNLELWRRDDFDAWERSERAKAG